MEPWYNMNRIEQIIGRARRNCSHKDLPLEERNVQLFLHATVLDEIESMDMFLYRKSEIKSIKIGKVSKILKSVAVDCILNKEQQSFSKMTEVVHIKLSDYNEIDYEVKDQPFTSLCDYSDTCEFECINKAGSLVDKTTYTYESAKNSKILDRIKELFTMKHVYHEEDLKRLIKTKNTSSIEIERAIYNMINDKELLIDKFGRKGYLININNLYLFQPIEIKNEHVTMYERTNPITYKPKMIDIDFESKKSKVKEGEEEQEDEQEHKSDSMEKLMTLYNKAKISKNKPESEKDDWYDFYYETIKDLKAKLTEEEIEQFLIFHICETFTFEEDLDALNIFFKEDLTDIENIVRTYYEQFMIRLDDTVGFILLNHTLKDPVQIYILNSQLTLATYEEKSRLSKEIKKKMNLEILQEKPLFKWIGYMGNYKGSYDFKIINTELEKLTSSVFYNKGRPEMYKILNETIQERGLYNKSPLKRDQLCIIEELYLRYFDNGDERHFLNKLEIYILNKKLR
jgi:hypothetical protein